MLIHSDQIIDGNACIFQDSCTVQVLGEYNCCVPAVKCGQAVRTRRSQGGGHTSQELQDGHREFEVYIYLQMGCIIVSGVESSQIVAASRQLSS